MAKGNKLVIISARVSEDAKALIEAQAKKEERRTSTFLAVLIERWAKAYTDNKNNSK